LLLNGLKEVDVVVEIKIQNQLLAFVVAKKVIGLVIVLNLPLIVKEAVVAEVVVVVVVTVVLLLVVLVHVLVPDPLAEDEAADLLETEDQGDRDPDRALHHPDAETDRFLEALPLARDPEALPIARNVPDPFQSPQRENNEDQDRLRLTAIKMVGPRKANVSATTVLLATTATTTLLTVILKKVVRMVKTERIKF